MKRTLAITIFILLLTASLQAGGGILSLSVARSRRKTATATERRRAQQFFKTAYTFYKRKQDTKAVKYYEAGLLLYATGQAYYHYGNSLSNVRRLIHAVAAYDIAIALGYARPHLAHYNAGCAWSRYKRATTAFKRLDQAIAAGYKNLRYMARDPDLAWLRSQPEWSTWYNHKVNASGGGSSRSLSWLAASLPKSQSPVYLPTNTAGYRPQGRIDPQSLSLTYKNAAGQSFQFSVGPRSSAGLTAQQAKEMWRGKVHGSNIYDIHGTMVAYMGGQFHGIHKYQQAGLTAAQALTIMKSLKRVR